MTLKWRSSQTNNTPSGFRRQSEVAFDASYSIKHEQLGLTTGCDKVCSLDLGPCEAVFLRHFVYFVCLCLCLCAFKETILARVHFQGILLHDLGLKLTKIILTTALTKHSRVPLYFLTLLTSLGVKVQTPRKSLSSV